MTALAAGEPARLAGALAGRLAAPRRQGSDQRWEDQSLARGAAGVALLHIERAHAGLGGQRSSAGAGTRDILAHHVIFHWNQIGLPYKTQSILAHAAKTVIFS